MPFARRCDPGGAQPEVEGAGKAMEDEGAGVEGADGEKVPDHAPLVTKGHSIGLQSKNTEVTFNLPRMASDTGLQLICDPGENYEMFPEMSRIFYSRRALVVHLLKLLVTLNKWCSSVYGFLYTFPAENVDAVPESGIPEGIPVLCKLTVTISEAFRASVAVDSDDEVSL